MTRYEALTSDVQNAHRRASAGISLRHSGHFRTVGSGGGSLRDFARKWLIGTTTKKNTTVAMEMKAMMKLIKSP